MAEVFGGCLDDPRVAVRDGRCRPPHPHGERGYDAILLDVDNGPDGLTRPATTPLRRRRALAPRSAALRPGGVLAVWSSGPDPGFTRRLRQAGFTVEEVGVRANGKRGARHVIWLATKA